VRQTADRPMSLHDRFFFHTFPRSGQSESPEATLNRALDILSFMKEAGLVLAPEIVKWELPLQGGGVEHLSILQRRACFTELSIAELDRHAATFGPISLSFNIDKLRAAGLTPVVYVPQGTGIGSLSQISNFCVKAAWHTRYVLDRLQDLKIVSDPASAHEKFGYPLSPDATLQLQNKDPGGNLVANYTVPASNVDAVMKHIGYRNIPFDHSIGMLSVFLNIFYPTDNAYSGELLGYYRQREWRLIGGGLNFNNRPIGRGLTPTEIARLTAIDQRFWSRELMLDGALQTRSALAVIYDPVQNWNFFDLVENVFVPRSIEARARSIAGDKIVVMDSKRSPE
jgi:hypothetical protein